MGQTAVAAPGSLSTPLRHCLMPKLQRNNDPSFNDCLLETPNIGMPKLTKVLLKIKVAKKIGFADISKCYKKNQIITVLQIPPNVPPKKRPICRKRSI